MSRDGVPMANAFRVQENCIKEVSIDLGADAQSFSTVEEKRNIKILLFTLPPEFEEFRDKVTELISHFFMANEVESWTIVSRHIQYIEFS